MMHEDRGQPLDANAVLKPLGRVTEREGLQGLTQRLFELRAWLADDLGAFEAALLNLESALGEGPSLDRTLKVGRAADHLLGLPGKRIRPLCVLLAARMGQRQMDKDVREVALACELVHAATLLHDDVIDDSHERRGAPASRILFGNSASILAGDYLLVLALRLVQSADNGILLPDLLQVMTRIVAAEALQLERRGRFDPDPQIYQQVVRGKTAALFDWGLRAGGTLGGLSDAVRATLGDVGMHLGLAFQLVDDILDVEGDPQVTGKETLQDLREGKLTWPIILASEASPALKAEFVELAASHSHAAVAQRASDVIAKVRATGALAESRAYAVREAQAACQRLTDLPQGRARDALELIVQSAVHRMN
jgi:octaprenyl-diphosphate synthase